MTLTEEPQDITNARKNAKEILQATPFEEWEVRPVDKALQILLNDNPSLTAEILDEVEKASLDILVVGREHGERSEAGVLDLIAKYRPDVIIDEKAFGSEKQKRIADVMTNCSVWHAKAIVNLPGKLEQDVNVIFPQYFTLDETDTQPIIETIHARGLRTLLRMMGETDPELRSMGGAELQGLYERMSQGGGESTTESEVLLDEEARKIIVRESIMVNDISRIVANVRRKLKLEKYPRLNVLVISGAFHAPYLERSVKAFGLPTASICMVDKPYVFIDVYNGLLPADRMLYDRVQDLRVA